MLFRSIKDSTEKIKIFIKGDELSDQHLYIDEFMLRPSACDVYAKKEVDGSGFLFYNNWWVKE